MENATKALLIAGAIIITLVIITLGIAVMNMGKEAVDKSNLDSVQTQTSNSQFTQYEGTQKGGKVKALINAVIAENANEDDTTQQIVVKYKGNDIVSNEKTDSSEIYTNKTYTVKITGYKKGKVSEISIMDKSN